MDIEKPKKSIDFEVMTKTKFCEFCKIDVDSRKWAVHTYLRSHKRAFKKCNLSIKIEPLDYNIKILKNELNDIKLQIDSILNKLSELNNI